MSHRPDRLERAEMQINRLERRLDRLEDTLSQIQQQLSQLEQIETPGTTAGSAEAEIGVAPVTSPLRAYRIEIPEIVPEPSLFDRPEPPEQIPETTPEATSHEPAGSRQPVPSTARTRSTADLVDLLSGRVLAFVGGLAILVGMVFFLSLAFAEGWIGPEERVVAGLVASALLITGGAWFFERREAMFGHVLLATGLGIYGLSLLAATRLYDLIPVEVGLVGSLLGTGFGALIAIRANLQVVAAYGLIPALIAPPLLGASPTAFTILFMGVVLAGTTAIALYRTWSWLPPLAFLLTFPQLGEWITGDPPLALGLAALTCYWLLNATAAGGEEFRIRRHRLRPTSATLLLFNVTVFVAFGFGLLHGDLESWRGLFLLGVAAVHFALGGYFLRAEGDRHPFGMLVFATGLAAFAIAIPVQLGGPPVPIAWAAQAAALAWVYGRIRNPFSLAAGALLGLAAIWHLALFEYPLPDILEGLTDETVFLNPAAGTLGFMLGALLVGGLVARSALVRLILTIIGLALVLYTLPFELSGAALTGSWAAMMLIAVVASERLPYRDVEPLGGGIEIPAVAAGALAGLHLALLDLPFTGLDGPITLPSTAFINESTLAAGFLIIALALAAMSTVNRFVRRGAVLVGLAVAAYLMPFQLELAAVVVAWAAIALIPYVLVRLDRTGWQLYAGTSAALILIALLVTVGSVAPPERLAVDAFSSTDHSLFWSGATAALGAIVFNLLAGYWTFKDEERRAGLLVIVAGTLALYALSIGIVDEFQGRVDAGASPDALKKQAQVALSICWSLIGMVAFVTGIGWRNAALRMFGLGLFGITIVKVFIVDLAALDTSYRVISFIVLGILLLASSYVYQRLAPAKLDQRGHEGET